MVDGLLIKIDLLAGHADTDFISNSLPSDPKPLLTSLSVFLFFLSNFPMLSVSQFVQ